MLHKTFYIVQDLESSKLIIAKMIQRKFRIKTIFNFIHHQKRWDSIGDYPIITLICSIAREMGQEFEAKKIVELLKERDEFKNVRKDSEIIKGLRA